MGECLSGNMQFIKDNGKYFFSKKSDGVCDVLVFRAAFVSYF